ncbi:hypothetical protein C8D03_2478 [Bosea sp. 124]|nr:hypothetical protein C8D03_2478 [Bosea sp. 124]
MVAMWRPPERFQSPAFIKRALYSESCRDEEGNPFNVVVWREWPGLSTTSYTLEDGTPVQYEDECVFRIVTTGKLLTRCD